MPREDEEPLDPGYETVELSSDAPHPVASELPAPGARIGRFIVLERVGEGGMGLVVAAYDPALDRKVAIKLLRREVWGDDVEAGKQRLLREARAMAKLSHPSVLAVYEVGLHGDQVFVAMEFAPGGTLRQWLEREPRSQREIIDAFLAAGRGLQVAHEAGLVHRDFKPENALLAGGGGVRVADFGIVGVRRRDGADEAPPAEGGDRSMRLTQTGATLGTPAYMAPEQHLGDPVDARADQFAYCVALYEALYGERPFAGDTRAELASAVIAAEVRPAKAGSQVPAWLRQVLVRGMAREPGDRFPSMAALLSALSTDPLAHRRRRIATAAAVAGGIALAALAVAGLSRLGDRGSLCHVAKTRLAGIWDADRRDALRDAFAASALADAPAIADRVAHIVDGYTADWVRARRDSCEATRVRGEQSEALLDARMACLDRRLGELDALLDVISKAPDAATVERSVEAVAGLTPVTSCDAAALVGGPPQPGPEVRAQVDEVRRRLDRAKALEDAGRYAEGLALARAAAEDARATDYPPVLAEATYVTGSLAEQAGEPAQAREAFEHSLAAAARAHDDRLVARIWARLLFTSGAVQGRPSEALLLRPGAVAALARIGDDAEIGSAFWSSLGNAYKAAGDYDEAARCFTRALALAERLPPHHRQRRTALTDLGNTAYALGHYQEAFDHHERALADWEQLVGADHPSYAGALHNVAMAMSELGDSDGALERYQRVLEIRERWLGLEHPLVGTVLNNIGTIHFQAGRWEQARDALERAVRIGTASLGADHPEVAMAHSNLAMALQELGDYDAAREHLERALAIKIERLGPRHRAVAFSRKTLAEVWLYQDRLRDARAEAEQAIGIFEQQPGPPQPLAESRFLLARILWASGKERRRALALARQARDTYAESGAEWASSRDAVDGWLRERTGSNR